MNWEDEPYIKEYIRDTVSFKLLPWQGKCIAGLIRRKLDRAGVMDLGEHRPEEAVAVMIDVPLEVVEVGLRALLSNKTFEIKDGCLISPHYIEAQEARQSDKARQRLSRQRRRDKINAKSVTNRDPIQSQNVTDCHTVSHGVTNRIEENRIEESRRDFNPEDSRKSDLAGWVQVIHIVNDTMGWMIEPHYSREPAEVLLRAAEKLNPDDPMGFVRSLVEAWKADEWVALNKPGLVHLARNIQKYATGGKGRLEQIEQRLKEIQEQYQPLEAKRQAAHKAKNQDEKERLEQEMRPILLERKALVTERSKLHAG